MAPIIPLPAIDDKRDRARAEATHSICSIRLESRFNRGGETRRGAPLYEVAVLTLPLRSSLPHPTRRPRTAVEMARMTIPYINWR